LIQGRGAHEEPLLWIISTQAADDLAVLSQEIDYALGAGKDDPAVKLFFFTTPDDYEIMDRAGWMLSNPALGDFLSEADMIEAANTAQNMPSSEPGFRNLRLNQRISVNSHFMSPGVWKKNSAIPDPDALSKGRITAGLDLSGKNDLSALVLDACYERYHNLFAYFWKPADLIQEHKKKDRVPYDTWIDQGYIEACPGKVIDYEYIAQKVL
jgi:phage terminase large subunit-like protein